MSMFHVLIADPNPLLLAACQFLLVGQGVEVTGVTNAHAFASCLEQFAVNLIVVDPEMPGLQLEKVLHPG
jgi:CheY-like chemotaxis protein